MIASPEYLKEISDIIIVHDSAFFPENNIWGNNIKKIEFIPESRYWYGKLDKSKTGEKNYDEVFKFWIEIYPEYPGHFSGPPTLFGSQKIDVAKGYGGVGPHVDDVNQHLWVNE